MISVIVKKKSKNNTFKWVFSGFSIFFISMLSIISVLNTLVGGGDTTPVAELCKTYGGFASPACW